MLVLFILACIGAYFGIGAAFSGVVIHNLRKSNREKSEYRRLDNDDIGIVSVLSLLFWPIAFWIALAYHFAHRLDQEDILK